MKLVLLCSYLLPIFSIGSVIAENELDLSLELDSVDLVVASPLQLTSNPLALSWFGVSGFIYDVEWSMDLDTWTSGETSYSGENTEIFETVASIVVGTPPSFAFFRLNVDADSDGDALPDSWEQQIVDFDLTDDITQVSDVLASDDFDGDGVSNEDEFAAGTDATDSTDIPEGYGEITDTGDLVQLRVFTPMF